MANDNDKKCPYGMRQRSSQSSLVQKYHIHERDYNISFRCHHDLSDNQHFLSKHNPWQVLTTTLDGK